MLFGNVLQMRFRAAPLRLAKSMRFTPMASRPTALPTTLRRRFSVEQKPPTADPKLKEINPDLMVETTPEDYAHRYFYVNQGYSHKLVSYWLFGAAAMVLFMISVGGYTRLKKAGLSMVKWKPVGYRYPKSAEEWEAEFTIYKQYPEFQHTPNMTLGEFKKIFNIEFFHRFVGNILGGYFALPMTYFWMRGYFTKAMKKRMSLLLVMGGMQGLIGWWMVRSGMDPKPDYQSRPRVSTYRLVVHNSMAMSLYYYLFYLAIRVGHPVRYYHKWTYAANDLKSIRVLSMLIMHFVAFNIISGVAVAGIDAGKVYNTWPLMNGAVVPSNYWRPELGWRNLFENMGTVQFNHRTFAYLTMLSTYVAMGKLWRKPLPWNLRFGLFSLFGLVNYQVLLGVLMLLEQVPVEKGVAHQLNAMLCLSAAIYLLAATRGKALRLV